MRKASLFGPARALSIGIVLAALLAAFACGSSSQTSLAPSSGVRCAVQGQAETTTFSADGGSSTLRISTDRECTWSVQSEASWVAFAGEARGQGEGTVPFTIAPNGDPAGRSGAVSVNDQRMQISQAGRPCELRLSSTQESVTASGGQQTVHVDASSSQCTWSAATDVPWISILEGTEGAGDGAVVFQVAPLTGPTRTGTLTIAGQGVTIQQGTGCTYATGVTTVNVSADGGRVDVPVVAPPGCAWTATSGVPWVTILNGHSGSGGGAVVLQIAGAVGPPRTGTVTIAGQNVTIQQGTGCTFATGVTTVNVSAAGGRAEVPVVAPPGCTWTATASVPWISITGGQSGSGGGVIVLQVAAVAGPPRTGTVAVGGQIVTVNQGSGCTFGTGVTAVNVTAAGGTVDVPVTAPAGCPWTTVSQVPWIQIASGGDGTGPGVVRLSALPTDGPGRSGTVTIAGVAVTVTQASGCRFSVDPAAYAAPPGGAASAVAVQTGAGCPWSAASETPWIRLPQPSGAGPAQVSFVVDPNNTTARSGAFTVAGHTVTVNQVSPCTFQLAPASADYDANGGRANVLVIVVGGCAWTAASTVDWIAMETGMSGAGDGLVQFFVAPNAGPARSGVVRIAGMDFVIRQSAR